MSGTRIGLLLAVGMGLLAAPVAAQPSAVDRTRLDALIAQIEKAEPEADQAAYRALADETLAAARRLYPACHPEVAARDIYVALSPASLGGMAPPLASGERVLDRTSGGAGQRGEG